MSYPKFNSDVCWIPLTNNAEKNDSLIVIPSKNPRFIKKTESFKNDNFTSEQYTSPLSSIEIKK